MFYKGDIDDNKYGPNPLIGQTSWNWLYRWIGITFLLISIIIEILNVGSQIIMFQDNTELDSLQSTGSILSWSDSENDDLRDTISTGIK